MATLNVTVNGFSADLPVDLQLEIPLEDIKRIAYEVIQAGDFPRQAFGGLRAGDLPPDAFRHYVVDRFGRGRNARYYLRPKVPFGGA